MLFISAWWHQKDFKRSRLTKTRLCGRGSAVRVSSWSQLDASICFRHLDSRGEQERGGGRSSPIVRLPSWMFHWQRCQIVSRQLSVSVIWCRDLKGALQSAATVTWRHWIGPVRVCFMSHISLSLSRLFSSSFEHQTLRKISGRLLFVCKVKKHHLSKMLWISFL